MPADLPTASARRQARGLWRLGSKSAAHERRSVASRSSSRGMRSSYRPVGHLGSVRNAAEATRKFNFGRQIIGITDETELPSACGKLNLSSPN